MQPGFSSLVRFDWVSKRDGRLVPFEPDKICRALFAATETLCRPDAFLARELTDGVLHFLAAEAAGTTPSTALIAEMVVKVVRELGQPALAQTFADRAVQKEQAKAAASHTVSGQLDQLERALPSAAPQSALDGWIDTVPSPLDLAWTAANLTLREYALRNVFARDLVAAQGDGLLTLMGLEAPLELASCVVSEGAEGPRGIATRIEEARAVAGSFVAIDGAEYSLGREPALQQAAADFVRELGLGLRATRLRAVLNLNCSSPPSWADDLAGGPLFAAHRSVLQPVRPLAQANALLEQALLQPSVPAPMRIDWHLAEDDFSAAGREQLLRLARLALAGAPLAFTFDRPRRPVSLAEGLDRQHPASLLAVGLHLPRLLEQIRRPKSPAPSTSTDSPSELFLHKLGTLVRLALSAAVQKRGFLRRHSHGRPALARGFLLDRARLVIVPVGLEAVTRDLFDRGPCTGGAPLEFARRIVLQLAALLREDGKAYPLEGCVDGDWLPALANPTEEELGPEPCPLTSVTSAGVTPHDPQASLQDQVKAAGPLQAAPGGGTVNVSLPARLHATAEEVVDLLEFAWRESEVIRFRLLRVPEPALQQTAPWEHA